MRNIFIYGLLSLGLPLNLIAQGDARGANAINQARRTIETAERRLDARAVATEEQKLTRTKEFTETLDKFAAAAVGILAITGPNAPGDRGDVFKRPLKDIDQTASVMASYLSGGHKMKVDRKEASPPDRVLVMLKEQIVAIAPKLAQITQDMNAGTVDVHLTSELIERLTLVRSLVKSLR